MSKKLTVTINGDNAAFEDDGGRVEYARILRRIAKQLDEEGRDEGKAIDVNGNTVGSYKVTV